MNAIVARYHDEARLRARCPRAHSAGCPSSSKGQLAGWKGHGACATRRHRRQRPGRSVRRVAACAPLPGGDAKPARQAQDCFSAARRIPSVRAPPEEATRSRPTSVTRSSRAARHSARGARPRLSRGGLRRDPFRAMPQGGARRSGTPGIPFASRGATCSDLCDHVCRRSHRRRTMSVFDGGETLTWPVATSGSSPVLPGRHAERDHQGGDPS